MKNSLLTLIILILQSACRPSSVKKAPPEVKRVEGQLRVALISNSFCQKTLYEKYKNAEVEFVSISGEAPQNCKLLPKYREELLGHFLLQRFLSELDAKRPVKIYAYDLYRKDGSTDREMWEIALGHLAPLNLHMIAVSIGVPDPEKKMKPLFFPEQASLLIHDEFEKKKRNKKVDPRWPHHSISKKSFILSVFDNENQVYESERRVYFHHVKRRVFLPPTLRALAVGMARFINYCEADVINGPDNLLECIKKSSTFIDEKFIHLPFKGALP